MSLLLRIQIMVSSIVGECELEQAPLVLTEGGHASAALMPINDADLESMALSPSPKFQAVIERAREEYRNGASLSADDVRRELGIE
jgi:hypothetical protein